MIPTGAARIAGVIGWPVAHSLSPRVHGFWLEHYRIDGAYVPLAVRPEDLREALAALPKLGFAGANVTVPHKEATLALVAETTATARRIGAVNTVVVGSRGRLRGDNTDAAGFLAALIAAVPGWRASNGAVVIVGAGGAARAISVAVADAGAGEIRIVNRTRARAEALAAAIGGRATVWQWADRAEALAGAGLLVNATTLGMVGRPALDLDLARLPPGAVVDDIVYSPLETPLLAAARRRGNPVVDGLGMLLHQARPGFAAWFGHEPEVTNELRRFVLCAA